MKRFLLIGVVATLCAACSKDATYEQHNLQNTIDRAPKILVAGFEDYDTRIQLNESQKTVWTNGDQVSVFYRSDANQKWQYNGETGVRIAELTCVDEAEATESMERVVVVYPYNENYYINTETYNVQATLPATQSYLKNSYGLDGNIMISLGEYNNFSLKSVCGWLKLQLTGKGEKVKSITLKGNNGEQVAGELYINPADATAILSSEAGDADDNSVGGNLVFGDTIVTEVTLDCGEGVALGTEATSFYIALPPQTFTKGFTVEVACTDGSKMVKSSNKPLSIERNTIQPMTETAYFADISASDVIWYTTSDGDIITPKSDAFGVNILSNTYKDGIGVINFDGDVTKIGEEAFKDCHSLTGISIPESVTVIDVYAFLHCSNLTNITIPNSVTRINDWAFHSCSALTSVTIPNSVSTLEQNAFVDCENLARFYGKYASEDGRCLIVNGVLNSFAPAGLTNYNIPDGVTSIGAQAFMNCSYLLNITIPDSVSSIRLQAFWGCSSLTDVIIPDSVNHIYSYAFMFCSSLTSIKIPNSVEAIGTNAFASCESLVSVYCEPTQPPTLGISVFASNAENRKIYVPASNDDSIINAYKKADRWSELADSIFENE